MDRARIEQILSDLTALETQSIPTLEPDAHAIGTAAYQVGLSWSGSALGHHAEMYFERFQRPSLERRFNAEWGTHMGWPRGWITPTVEEVEAEISRLSGVDLVQWKERYGAMMSKLCELQGSLSLEISSKAANPDPKFERIVSNIEATKFDDSHAKKYLLQQLNAHRSSISRDLRAFHQGLPPHIGPHYQMKIRKITEQVPGTVPPSSVTNIYNVHGPNARFNSQSVDQSHNVVRVDEGELFKKLKQAIHDSVNSPQREQLVLAVDEMSAHAGSSSFGDRFQRFMSLASNCMTVVTPFLPALANLAASVHH